MSEKIILGNIVTMDDSMPKAEACAIKDGIIVKVGTEAEARAAVSASAEVLDYKGQWVYPGFLEPHTHGMFAGYRAIGQADLSNVIPTDYDVIADIIKKYVADNPEKDLYMAAGWSEDTTPIDHTYLDAICSDKPLIMNTGGGHSCLLNKKAMEVFGFDKSSVEKYGTALVHVDAEGNPDGYICEEPCIKLLGSMSHTIEDIKKYLLNWQEKALSEGITAVADAGVELLTPAALDAYKELEDEGKLVVRNYAYLLAHDNTEDPTGVADEIANKAKKYSGEYFKVIGIKAFLDGVIEAHTGWLIDDYNDEPGYHGVERFNDPDKMVELLVAAQKHGMSVHVHSEGDGATRFMLNCIEKAEEITGDLDQRNMLAHLHIVADEEIKKMAKTKSIAAVAPLWTTSTPGVDEQEIQYIGQERFDNNYPIKSFVDQNATIVFHSDYPITPVMNIAESVFMAKYRATTFYGADKVDSLRHNIKEGIDNMDSLKAVTTNVAYAWKEEDRMGSISVGKLANFAVTDTDLLNGELMKIPTTKILATIIDGNVVYENK